LTIFPAVATASARPGVPRDPFLGLAIGVFLGFRVRCELRNSFRHLALKWAGTRKQKSPVAISDERLIGSNLLPFNVKRNSLGGNFGCSTVPWSCAILHHLLEIVWRLSTATEKANTAFASTINGGFASSGGIRMRTRWKLSTITKETRMRRKKKLLPPILPGEILREEYLKPMSLRMNKVALDLRVPVTRISEIVHERRGITTDTALRLARYFNTTARFWLNLQGSYDLEIAEDESSDRIEQEVLPAARREFSLT
jgi:addiction module HigA family antidote